MPPQVEPVFIGFQTSHPKVIRRHFALFKKHEPIGCRDVSTALLFRDLGIQAFVSGCLSMTLPRRSAAPPQPKTFIVHGEGEGELPAGLAEYFPNDMGDSIRIYQRKRFSVFPLSRREALEAEAMASNLLQTYQNEATLIVTPLLHAATPCLAMGLPVILARRDYTDRFTAISRIIPVYTPEHFSKIQWNPTVPDVQGIKTELWGLFKRALRREGPLPSQIAFFRNCFENGIGAQEGLASVGSQKGRLWDFFRFS